MRLVDRKLVRFGIVERERPHLEADELGEKAENGRELALKIERRPEDFRDFVERRKLEDGPPEAGIGNDIDRHGNLRAKKPQRESASRVPAAPILDPWKTYGFG